MAGLRVKCALDHRQEYCALDCNDGLLEGAVERDALAIRFPLELEARAWVVQGQHEPQHPPNLR